MIWPAERPYGQAAEGCTQQSERSNQSHPAAAGHDRNCPGHQIVLALQVANPPSLVPFSSALAPQSAAFAPLPEENLAQLHHIVNDHFHL